MSISALSPSGCLSAQRADAVRDASLRLTWRAYAPGDVMRVDCDMAFRHEMKHAAPAWLADGLPPGMAWTIERGQGFTAQPVAVAGLEPPEGGEGGPWTLWALVDQDLTLREWVFITACVRGALNLFPRQPIEALADPGRAGSQLYLERLGFAATGQFLGQTLMTRRL